MTELDFCLPIALVVLVAYLLWSFNRRLNAEITKAESRYRDWQGHGFETTTVSPKLELLRRDYVSAARSRRPPGFSHAERVTRTRCAVRGLSFFRHSRRDTDSAEQSNEKPMLGANSA